MFYGCTSLTSLTELPSINLLSNCYSSMFRACSSIKLSSTSTGDYIYSYRIPTEGNGTQQNSALSSMFSGTGGTFTGSTPTINTTYYTTTPPVSANPINII